MLIIKTIIKPSNVYSSGCYTLENLHANQKVWVYNRAEMMKCLFDTVTCNLFNMFGFYDPYRRTWIIPGDNARFIRAVDSQLWANLTVDLDGEIRTARRIYEGEELLEWYEGGSMHADDVDRYKLAKEQYKQDTKKKVEKKEEIMSQL